MENAGQVVGKPPFVVILQGRKGSGKSEFIKYVCFEYKEFFSYIVVISASNEANGFYSEFLPEAHIHNSYEPSLIENIVTKQTDLFKKKKTHMLLVLDDILGVEGLKMSSSQSRPELLRLYTQNRHLGISLMVSTQGVKQIPRVLRNNADYVVIFRSLLQSKNDLYEELSHLPKKEWHNFLDQYTQDYRVLIFKTKEQDTKKMWVCFKIPQLALDRKFKLMY